MKQYTCRILLIIFTVFFSVPGVVTGCLAATIKGKIVSDRIDQFEDFVVYIKYVDPELFTLSKKTILSVQKNSQIFPRVLPIVSNKEVIFFNQDPHSHNLHAVTDGPIRFNVEISSNTKYGPVKFSHEGEVMLLCDIHPEMKGFILILQNPFFSKVDKNGSFSIPKVPKGEYELLTWHDEYISKKQRLIIEDTDKKRLLQFTY